MEAAGKSTYCRCVLSHVDFGSSLLAWLPIPHRASRWAWGASYAFADGRTGSLCFGPRCGTQWLWPALFNVVTVSSTRRNIPCYKTPLQSTFSCAQVTAHLHLQRGVFLAINPHGGELLPVSPGLWRTKPQPPRLPAGLRSENARRLRRELVTKALCACTLRWVWGPRVCCTAGSLISLEKPVAGKWEGASGVESHHVLLSDLYRSCIHIFPARMANGCLFFALNRGGIFTLIPAAPKWK